MGGLKFAVLMTTIMVAGASCESGSEDGFRNTDTDADDTAFGAACAETADCAGTLQCVPVPPDARSSLCQPAEARLALEQLTISKSCDYCRLIKTTLIGVELPTYSLVGATFHEANLRAADLGGTYLGGARFVEADLMNAKLDYAALDGATFDRAEMGQVTLRGATGNEPSFDGVYLWRADFREAALTNADMDGVDVSGANFDASVMAGTRFRDAFMHGASFVEADLEGVDFTGAAIDDADFTGASMKSAVLAGASFDRPPLCDEATRLPASFECTEAGVVARRD